MTTFGSRISAFTGCGSRLFHLVNPANRVILSSLMSSVSSPLPTDSDILVQVSGVSKKFCLSLKKSLWYGLKDMGNELLGRQHGGHGGLRPKEFWAVKDVSFELKRGECLGLIGRNGAGKTTLLKMLNGLIKPDAGRIEMRGRVGALIALGAGFNPILTGRENIYINASVLGLSKKETDAKLDEIIDFAEIGEFIDTPVQNYSSGMNVRLGFAVASSLDPDILLVDEVLAVGDISFRAKCAARIQEIRARGTAIIFVSHDMASVQSLCDQVLWLAMGRVQKAGPSPDVIGEYVSAMNRAAVERERARQGRVVTTTGDIDIVKVVLRDASGKETDCIRSFDPLTIELHYQAWHDLPAPYFWIGIQSQYGAVGGANMLLDGCRQHISAGVGKIICHFGPLPLFPQVYRINAGIRAADGISVYLESRQIAMFRVETDVRALGLSSEMSVPLVGLSSPVILAYRWVFADGSRYMVAPKQCMDSMRPHTVTRKVT